MSTWPPSTVKAKRVPLPKTRKELDALVQAGFSRGYENMRAIYLADMAKRDAEIKKLREDVGFRREQTKLQILNAMGQSLGAMARVVEEVRGVL